MLSPSMGAFMAPGGGFVGECDFVFVDRNRSSIGNSGANA
jgi:hypothetical protein